MIALGAAYIDQAAIEGGRHNLAWLLTSLQQPAWNKISQNVRKVTEEPHSDLVEATWIQANLAYMKDLDYLAEKQRQAAAPTPSVPQKTPPSGASEAKPKRKPRARGPKKAD